MSEDNNKQVGTTFSIEDIERVVSAIVKQQGQIQKDQVLSVITDLDKDRTRMAIAMSELKVVLFDALSKGLKQNREEIFTFINGVEERLEEEIGEFRTDLKDAGTSQRTANQDCKESQNKKIEEIGTDFKNFKKSVGDRFEAGKPNYYAIFSVVLLLTSPFVKWVFDLHNEAYAAKTAIAIIKSQQTQMLEQQKSMLNLLDEARRTIASPTSHLGKGD